MKPIVLLLLPLLCPAAVAPNELNAVLDLARSAPGEFAADALIRVASLDALEKTKRIELLEEAFHRASEAQQPWRREATITRIGGAAVFLNRAYGQELDGLSLRLRAVNAMLAVDSRKARDLFTQIPPLDLPKVDCGEFLVYNVDLFYEVLGEIASRSFTTREVARHEPLMLLEQQAGNLKSPAQVAPMAQLLVGSSFKDADLQSLASAFSGSLGKIMGDDRSFTHYAEATGPAVLRVVEELKKRQLNPLPLIEAYRLYLVNNLAGTRCADDDLMQHGGYAFSLNGRPANEVGGEAALFYDHELRMPPLRPLTEDEMTPSKLEGAASGLRRCRETECTALAAQYRGLIFDASGSPLSANARDTAEWQARLQQFLNALASWKPGSDVSYDEYFREECDFYSGMVGALPNGPRRQDVVLLWLDFLRQSRTQMENRIEWFLPVNSLIARVGVDPLGLGKIADQLRKAGDPVIALYVELERVAPRSAERIAPVL
jgi:hypothetical protein